MMQVSRVSRRALVIGVCVFVGAVAMVGCATQAKPEGPTGPLPLVQDVIARYNARVERLEAIESPVELVIRATNADGEETKEQGEGNLKMVRPRKIALRIDKLAQTFFWLGSNDEEYWWFDLRGDEKVALVGTHARAKPEVAARFGLPVHPVDLLDLAGVAPLEGEEKASISWAKDGRGVVVEMPGRWGVKRLTIEPKSGEASAVEILDETGSVVVSSRLEKYEAVKVRGDAAATARMATRLVAEVPSAKATVELLIHTPVNNGAARIKDANFVYDELKRVLGAEKEIDLDRVEAQAP